MFNLPKVWLIDNKWRNQHNFDFNDLFDVSPNFNEIQLNILQNGSTKVQRKKQVLTACLNFI